MWYTDFVVEMDARFLPGDSLYSSKNWRFHFRQFYTFIFEAEGDVTFEGLPGGPIGISRAFQSGQNASHVLVIVKDQDVALFINDQPVYHGTLEPGWKNGSMMFEFQTTVGFDNFKIWDISDIFPTVTPAP
jgi:hypothetical protein